MKRNKNIVNINTKRVSAFSCGGYNISNFYMYSLLNTLPHVNIKPVPGAYGIKPCSFNSSKIAGMRHTASGAQHFSIMHKPRVLLDFKRYSIPVKIEFGRNCVALMKALFTDPDIDYAEITAKTDSLEVKYNAAIDGGKALKASMRKAEDIWDIAMTALAHCVNRLACHDEEIIRSTGFHPSRPAQNGIRLEFEVRHGKNLGEVILKCFAGKERATRLWQYREVSVSAKMDWIDLGGTVQSTKVVKNLNSKTTYEFRYAKINKDGQGDWSLPVTIYIL